MVSCFKKLAPIAVLTLALSCGSDGVAPLTGTSTAPLKGTVTTYAGTATVSGNNVGARTSATFADIEGITSDGSNLYICDWGNAVVKRLNLSTGIVDILAGGTVGSNDGTGTSAQFDGPLSIVHHKGKLYIIQTTDSGGIVTLKLRVIDVATKVVTTGTTSGNLGFWGFASDGTNLYASNGTKVSKINTSTFALTDVATGFAGVKGITYGGGYLWVSDPSNFVIYRVDPSNGTKTIVAGVSGSSGTIDGAATTTARFDSPTQLAYLNGVLYIYDDAVYQLRTLNIATATVSTIAGQYGVHGHADGTGTNATFNAGFGFMTTDGKSVFLNDSSNFIIRKID